MISINRDFETGIFKTSAQAENAVQRLREIGYERDQISVIFPDGTLKKPVEASTDSGAAEGVATGAVLGGTLGAVLAAATATGAVITIGATGGLATPLVIGPLAAALAGLGAGGAAGGLLGGLIGAGVGDARATEFENAVGKGGIVVGVSPRSGQIEIVREILGTMDSHVVREAVH